MSQSIWNAFAVGDYLAVFEQIEQLEEADIQGQIEKAYILSYLAEADKSIALCNKLASVVDDPVQSFNIQVIKSIDTLWIDDYATFQKVTKECRIAYQSFNQEQQQQAQRFYFTLQGIEAIAKLETRKILEAEQMFLSIIKHHESTERVSPPWEQNSTLGYLGIINSLKGNFDQAEKWFIQRIEHSIKHNNKIQIARSNQQLATLYWKTDRFDKAIDLYTRSKSIIAQQLKQLNLNRLSQYLNEINYNLVLIFLEKEDIGQAVELFETIQSQSKGFERNVDRVRLKILEALILITDNRAKSIVKAYLILDNLSDVRIDDPNVYIYILLQKYQLLLWEFEATGNSLIMDELDTLFKDIVEISTQLNSDYLTVELTILEIQRLLLNEEFSRAVKHLEECEQLARQNHHNGLLRKLREIDTSIKEDINRWESISTHPNLVERVHQSKMKDYIKTALKSVSTMQSGR